MILMKNVIKNRLAFIGLLVSVVTILFSSCSDEDSYDFPGDSSNRVFVRNNSLNYQFIHTPVSSMSTLDFKAPVYTTLKTTAMIKAVVEVDNTLVDVYNKQNAKELKAIPDNALIIENSTMTIPNGAMRSSDSIHITINESVLPELRDEKGYLIPLKLTNVEGKNVVASTNVNYMYLTVTTISDEDMIKDNATDGDAQGTLIEKRNTWTAYLVEPANVNVTGVIENIFDGNTKTEWKVTSSEPFSFVVDMQKEYDVTAISAYYSYYGFYDTGSILKDFQIESSKNGSEWINIGTVPNIAFDAKNIVFNGPVGARYLKITVPTTTDWYGNKSASVQIGEFSIYVK